MNRLLDALVAAFSWLLGRNLGGTLDPGLSTIVHDTVGPLAERIDPYVPEPFTANACPFFVADTDDLDVCVYCDAPRLQHSPRALADIG